MFYIVATPIGNSKDISLRAVKTLTAADMILCEDTRTFSNFYQKIQQVFKVYPQKPQKLIPFHKENEYEKIPLVISQLKGGKKIALVSESGMPAIYDPGNTLINRIIKVKIPFTVVPGPTAFINAAVLSGFSLEKILFLGFFPRKQSQIIQLFKKLKQIKEILKDFVVVFYESPHRINKTLKMSNQILPEAEISIAREMTKKFEEVIRGKANEILNKKYKGEITVVVKI